MAKYILIALLLLTSDCNKKREMFHDKIFDKKIVLKGEVIIKQSHLKDPTLITAIDSFLVIGNNKGIPLIEIFSMSGNLIKKIINHGKGPNEMLMIGDIQNEEKNKKVYITDLFQKKIIACDLDSVIGNNNYLPNIYFNIAASKTKKLMIGKILVGNDMLIGESRSPKGRIVILDSEGKRPIYYLNFPDKKIISKKISYIQNAKLYASTHCLSPDGKNYAIATYSAGMLDLIHINKNKVDIIWSNNEFYPQGIKLINMGEKQLVTQTQESVSGYLDICCSDRNVYALFSGKMRSKIDYGWGNVIRVVSWDTHDKFEYILRDKVKRIAVSKNDKFLYGISESINKEPEIIRFILKAN